MPTITEEVRNAMVDAVSALLDGGHVEVRSGAAPADPDDPATGDLLATVALNTPAFGAAVGGVATADVTPPPENDAAATGTAGHVRAYTAANAAVMDVNVGDGLALSSSSILTDTPVQIVSWTLTMPDGS